MLQNLRSEENIKFLKETIIFHTKILAMMYGFILVIILLYLIISNILYLNIDAKAIIEAVPFVPAFIILALNLGMAVFYVFQKKITQAISSILLALIMFVIACVFAVTLLVIMAILGALFKLFSWIF